MIDRLLDAIAPHPCCSCGALGAILCEYCIDDIVHEPYEQCVGCLRPAAPSNLCGRCRDINATEAWCVTSRTDAMKTLLDQYKFEGVRAAVSPLVVLLDKAIPLLPQATVVTAVPTASAHIRVRGYDHMGLIAKQFAKTRGVTYQSLLERRTTVTQHLMKNKQQRLREAERAFRVSYSVMPRCVLLLDDIMTTGATIKAAAELLRQAGVEQLMLGVLARQPFEVGKKSF